MEAAVSFMDSPFLWFLSNMVYSLGNIVSAVSQWNLWLDWLTWEKTTEDKQSLMRFIYYGASTELFFAFFTLLLIYTALAMWYRPMMWRTVIALESFANGLGRFFAWSGLIMVLIQIVIIFSQRVFAVSEISIGLGISFSFDVSWWAESLKFYNAMIIALCVTYTFVQGGHVRVDLIYANVSFKTKRLIDMFGALFFMLPSGILIWMYSWFFFWRHMVVPKPSASDTVERLVMKARALRWNVETIGFSPNGFNAYFLFKVLILAYTALIIIHAVAFFYRSFLEWREGAAVEGYGLDLDPRNTEDAAIENQKLGTQ